MNHRDCVSMLHRSSMRGVLIVVVFVLLAAFACVPKAIFAMTVAPVLIDVRVDPGSFTEKRISIKNDSKAMAYYVLTAENFTASGESGLQEYSGESMTGLASWFSWSTSTIAVKPGETVSVPVKISVPADAGSGGHYATVFVSRGASGSRDVGLHEQVGVLFLARVSGEVIEKASIESFRIKTNGSWSNRLPVSFDLRIRNEGGSHIRPEGNVVIKNAIGKTVALLPINAFEGAVLPRSIRKFEMNWGKIEISARNRFWVETINELKHFAFGRYVAEVRAAYGEQNHSFDRNRVAFWIMPWHLLVVLVSGSVICMAAYGVIRHCYVRCVVSTFDSRRKMKRVSTSKKKF